MAYQHRTASAALKAALRDFPRLDFIKLLARSAVDYGFQQQYRQLRRIDLQQIVTNSHDIRLAVAPHAWGETPIGDLIALCTLVRAGNPRFVFEFGTYTGNATLHFAMNAGPDATIYTLDLPPGMRQSIKSLEWEADVGDQVIGTRFAGTPWAKQIQQLYADSRNFDPTPYRQKCDFIWVDACHEYEFVRSDSVNAFKMAAPNATIAWHDHSPACPGVGRYLAELARERQVFWIEGTQIAFCKLSDKPE